MKNLVTKVFSIVFITMIFISCGESPMIKYNCEVVKTEPMKPFKNNIYVTVQNKLTEQQLTEVAQHIREMYSEYTNLFIFYNLPENEIGSGAWATTHFKPKLELKILGVSEEKENQIKNEIEVSSNTIGKWYCGFTGLEHSITFEKVMDKYIVKQKFKDGSKKEETLIKKTNGRFDIEGNKNGEYYILNSAGDLEFWDKKGLFTTAKKID